MFKGIPYQIKLTTTSDESRKQLPDYFVESMLKLGSVWKQIANRNK